MELKKIREESYKKEEFAPLSFWAWNDLLEDEEICEQIREFHEQGFGGFFMHSRSGLRTPYLSKEWFDRCRTAAGQAKKLGMQAWIYDEDGWPSGFAGGLVNGKGEEYCGKYFNFTETKPKEEESARVIAAFVKKEESYVPCENGEEGATLWAVYQVEPNYADMLSHKAVREFIDVTYERYKEELGEYFGTVVPGFFTDEPQYAGKGFPYSAELPEYFYARNHRRMEAELYRLMPQMQDEESEKYRICFWETIQAMMRENFSRQIGDWCEENHVIFTGHYPGEDSLLQQLSCTAGVMPKYEHMQMPGIDHLGRRITSLLLTKQVGSAAKQNGQKKILSETFGCAGWNIPFQDMCYIWAWQALQGVNVPVLHIGAYSMAGIRKRDYPAFFSYQEPWWDCFGHMSGWMSGLASEMAWGRWQEKVLVISPMESIYAMHSANRRSDRERSLCASYRLLCDHLTNIQVGFDLGDETMIVEKGAVENGTFRIGCCAYEIVVVAETDRLKETTWGFLEEFRRQGGTVVFTETVPERNGRKEQEVNCPVICNVERFWQKYFQKIRFKRAVTFYEENGFRIASGLNVAVKEENGEYRIAVMNLVRDSVRRLKLSISGYYRAERIDPETQSRAILRGEEFCGKETSVYPLQIHGEEIVVLALIPEKQSEKEARMAEGERIGQTVEDTNKGCLCEEHNWRNVRDYNVIFQRTAENALTLDYASYSFDGKTYSEELPVIRIQDMIYRDEKADGAPRLYLRYTFYNSVQNTAGFRLVAENRRCEDILCNGTSVLDKQTGWYMDHGFSAFSIEALCCTGGNTIEMIYQLGNDQVKDIEGLFETERNRFFYPVEPESVYVIGDFAVKTEAAVCHELTYIRAGEDGKRPAFEIVQEHPITRAGDLTEQGLWFYRGNAHGVLSMSGKENQRTLLRFTEVQAACVEVRVGNKSRVSYMEPYTLDITEMLQEGENEVELILHGTNRNLLGPHHQIQGEDLFIGGNSFKGIRGWEAAFFHYELEEESLWTDTYAFVPFGCGRIQVIREGEDSGEIRVSS
ncbi:MAG: hypothetical protein Q4C60_03835 [Eubacteriales bacterium]|nr:hypothetical protein [Eubacteriales bacterium]